MVITIKARGGQGSPRLGSGSGSGKPSCGGGNFDKVGGNCMMPVKKKMMMKCGAKEALTALGVQGLAA